MLNYWKSNKNQISLNEYLRKVFSFKLPCDQLRWKALSTCQQGHEYDSLSKNIINRILALVVEQAIILKHKFTSILNALYSRR